MPLLAKRIFVLVALSSAVAVAANSLLPLAVPWIKQWDSEIETRALRAGITPLHFEETSKLIREPGTLFLDARLWPLVIKGRLPGARNASWATAKDALTYLDPQLKQADRIVVYCSDRHSDAGLLVGGILTERGFDNVGLFVGGFIEWAKRSGPIERPPD